MSTRSDTNASVLARAWARLSEAENRTTALALMPALVAGLALRCYALPRQVLGGDELHAVRVVLQETLRQALTTYHAEDNCLPLTGMYRLASDLGLPLTEMVLRLPILLASVTLLLVLPVVVIKAVGRAEGIIVAWLVALSPSLVLYGRIVRSYLPIITLGALAATIFWMWWKRPRPALALAYAVTAAVATYFHPVAGPFVSAPMLFAGLRKLVPPRAKTPSWSALVAVGLVTLVCFLVFIVPTWSSLMELVESKRVGGELSPRLFESVARLQSGSQSQWASLLFWIAAGLGTLRLLLRKTELAIYLLALFCGQLAGILFLSPFAFEKAHIFSRYFLITSPVVFVMVATGVAVRLQPRRGPLLTLLKTAATLPAASLLGILLFTGPFADPRFLSSSFAHRAESLFFIRPFTSNPGFVTPPIYDDAMALPSAEVLVEHPWHTAWRYSRVFALYQLDHGRQVIVSPAEKLLFDPRLAFRNMVPGDPQKILDSRGDVLIIHLDLESEEQALDFARRPPRRGKPGPARQQDDVRRARELNAMCKSARKLARQLVSSWGPPDCRSKTILVWDLNRIRTRAFLTVIEEDHRPRATLARIAVASQEVPTTPGGYSCLPDLIATGSIGPPRAVFTRQRLLDPDATSSPGRSP